MALLARAQIPLHSFSRAPWTSCLPHPFLWGLVVRRGLLLIPRCAYGNGVFATLFYGTGSTCNCLKRRRAM